MAKQKAGSVEKGIRPHRRLEVTVGEKLEHDFVSLVQYWFMQYNRYDAITKKETPKQRERRMQLVLRDIAEAFLKKHADEIQNVHSFEDAIQRQALHERILADRSIFINRIPLSNVVDDGKKDGTSESDPKPSVTEEEFQTFEDIELREKVFKEVFGILDHAWRAIHSGFYATSLQELAVRVQSKDEYWNTKRGREKLAEMGLDVEQVLKDRTRFPLLFGPAEQLNPLPSLLTVDDSTDIVGSIEEANTTLQKILGMYIELTPLVQKKMLLCLPTLGFDQVSSGGPTVNTHFHTEPGVITELFPNNELKASNRLPMVALQIKIRPEPKMNPKTGKAEYKKGEVSFKAAMDAVEDYIKKIENEPRYLPGTDPVLEIPNPKRQSDDKILLAQRFLGVLKRVDSKYQGSFSTNYVEFAQYLNTEYIREFFPKIPMPIEFIDAQMEGRFGNFMKYITNMDRFVDFMVKRRFFESEDELCIRISAKKSGEKYTKFARYYWNKETQKFEVNPHDKMDSESDVGKEFPSLTLEEVQNTDNFVSIPLKAIEYMSFGFGIMPEMVILDDGVYFESFKRIAEACAKETGELPNYTSYNPVNPTQTGY